MSFYGFVEKVEFESLIKEAKKSCIKDAMKKLKDFDAMNENFFRAAMPDDTPHALIKKRTNKLQRMKRAKEIKKYFGYQ